MYANTQVRIEEWATSFKTSVTKMGATISRRHTGYPESTNATENNKRNEQAGTGCKYLSGNNLPRMFPERYLLPLTAY